jgi:hypothetical protein
MMALLNLFGYALIDWRRPATRQVVDFSILIFLGYFVLWFYRRGRNWARALVFVTSIVCFLNLYLMLHGRLKMNLAAKFMVMAEAAVAAFLVAWLYSPQANRFFSGQRNPGRDSQTGAS